jgi:type II secretory pathway pseudopilin PulG
MRPSAAFTILEVLIAITVMVVALGAALEAMGGAHRTYRNATDRDAAVREIARQIETLQQVSSVSAYDRLQGGGWFAVPGLSVPQGATAAGRMELAPGTTRNDDIIRIAFTVSWRGIGADQTITVPYSHVDR